jgi:hypothetical protein
MTTTPGSLAIPDRPFRREELLAQGLTKADFYRLAHESVIRCVVR